MTAYYNENDPYVAQWLRNLIKAGHIAAGDVDDRSIVDVNPDDLKGYAQCHFFAGIGGWSYALRIANWPDEQSVWTGSCPCQPLSIAGQRKGHADERHLWPAFFSLIAKCAPPIIFGEQVASKDGREWLAGIRADLETVGYACGAADLCAAGVGAPHPRQRLYWLADSGSSEWWPKPEGRCDNLNRKDTGRQEASGGYSMGGENGPARMANADKSGEYGRSSGGEQPICDGLRNTIKGMGHTGHKQTRRPTDTGKEESGRSFGDIAGSSHDLARLGNAPGAGLQGQWSEYCPSGERHSGLVGFAMQIGVPQWNGPTIAVECSDGPRRVSAQSNSFPLAHGVSGRMGRLRAYGNAIVPQVAAEFIKAANESLGQ